MSTAPRTGSCITPPSARAEWEAQFHLANPKIGRVKGLRILRMPDCEGGGVAFSADDACLIAAAPKLLAACKVAIAAIKGREHTRFLEAAIAKAEGTASERTDSAGEKRSSTP